MTRSVALIDELERQLAIVERLWSVEPPVRGRRRLREALGRIEAQLRLLLLRARCGDAGDLIWREVLACGRRLDRLRADWHRDPLAA